MVHGARDRIELGDKPPGSRTESAGGAEPPAQLTIFAEVFCMTGSPSIPAAVKMET